MTYNQRLAAIGVDEKEVNIRNKLARRKFSAVFLDQCLEAIGSQSLRLPFAASGQAQEQPQQDERSAQREQRPTEIAPVPLPVEIIESQAAAEARERHEAEARQRAIDDLAAQQGMNAATQAMNDATQRMAEYAFWSTIFVGVGTALLVWTLHLTRQANYAAVEAVEVTRDIGHRQLRAYLLFSNLKIEGFSPGNSAVVTFEIHNFGQTPANAIWIAYGLALLADPENGKIRAGSVTRERSVFVLGNNKYLTQEVTVDIPSDVGEFNKCIRGEINLIFFGYISYKDIFGITRRTLARGHLNADSIRLDGSGTFRVTARHNRAT